MKGFERVIHLFNTKRTGFDHKICSKWTDIIKRCVSNNGKLPYINEILIGYNNKLTFLRRVKPCFIIMQSNACHNYYFCDDCYSYINYYRYSTLQFTTLCLDYQ